MAYPVMPARPPRPATVTAGAALVFLGVAALVIIAVAQFSVIAPTSRAVEAASDGTADEGFGTAFAATLFGGGGALNVVFAVILAILAGFDLAGRRAARIMTWIVAPIAALCCGCFSGVYTDLALNSGVAGASTSSQDLSAEQLEALGDALPAYFTPAVLISVVVLVLSVLGAVISLALPPSNEYFRKHPEMWMPAPQWPGHPGGYPGAYPASYPGYPQAGPTWTPGGPPPAAWPPQDPPPPPPAAWPPQDPPPPAPATWPPPPADPPATEQQRPPQ